MATLQATGGEETPAGRGEQDPDLGPSAALRPSPQVPASPASPALLCPGTTLSCLDHHFPADICRALDVGEIPAHGERRLGSESSQMWPEVENEQQTNQQITCPSVYSSHTSSNNVAESKI